MLTATARGQLVALLAAGPASARLLLPARIPLQADQAVGGPGWGDERLADTLGLPHPPKQGRWLNRRSSSGASAAGTASPAASPTSPRSPPRSPPGRRGATPPGAPATGAASPPTPESTSSASTLPSMSNRPLADGDVAPLAIARFVPYDACRSAQARGRAERSGACNTGRWATRI